MDAYFECMVRRQVTTQMKIKRAIWIVVCVIAAVAMLLMPEFILAFAVALFLALNAHRQMSALYEYIYADGGLTFTRMTTNRRKQMFSCHMEKVEQVCPYSEFRAPGNPKAFVKVYDFGSGEVNDDLYVMVVISEAGKLKVFFEPSEEMLDGMRRSYPRIVTKRRA